MIPVTVTRSTYVTVMRVPSRSSVRSSVSIRSLGIVMSSLSTVRTVIAAGDSDSMKPFCVTSSLSITSSSRLVITVWTESSVSPT